MKNFKSLKEMVKFVSEQLENKPNGTQIEFTWNGIYKTTAIKESDISTNLSTVII